MEKLKKELDLCEDQVDNLARQLRETRTKLRSLREKDELKKTEINNLKEQMRRLSADYSSFLNRHDLTLRNIIRKKSLNKSKKRYKPLSKAKARELSARFKRTLKERRLATAEKGLKDFIDKHSIDNAVRRGERDISAEAAKEWKSVMQKISKKRHSPTFKGGRRRTRRRRGGAPRLQPNASLEEVINVVNECCAILPIPEENAYKKRKIAFGKGTPDNPFGITYGRGGTRRRRRRKRRTRR